MGCRERADYRRQAQEARKVLRADKAVIERSHHKGDWKVGLCVELAVRDAFDRGFPVIQVEDATASWSAERQHAAIQAMRDRSAKVKTAAEVLGLVARLEPAAGRA